MTDAAGSAAPLILIIEDRPDMSAFLADALRPHYRLAHALDGRDGLTQALARPPDLILSDAMAPGMGGDEIVIKLRLHPVLADVPIVMLTALADKGLRLRLVKAGVLDYLNEPFSAEELLVRVASLVAGRRRTTRALERSALRLRRLAEVVERIAAAHDLPTLMGIVRRALRELTGADGATLVLRDNGQCHYADEDAIGPLWKGQRFPLESCISGWAMLNAKAAVIEDIYADPRIPHAAYRPTFVKSLSMVPVGRDEPVAAVGCYWASRHHASEEELELQQALADAMSIGLANIRLYQSLEQKVAERTAELEQLNSRLRDEVAEHARAEQRARTHEAYLTALVSTAPDAIIVIDSQGRVELCNAAMEKLFGYGMDELVGRNVSQLMSDPHRDAHDGYLRHYLESGEAQVIGIGREVEGLTKDGRLVPLFLKVGEMDTDGERHFVGFLHDISKRKQAEAERERYLAELERSNRELDDFAYVASHDLKEPLRGIHNYASFVIEDYAQLLPQDGQDKLVTLTRLSARMEGLINDLLYYSRVGRWEPRAATMDMNDALVHACESLSARLAESGGRVETPRALPPAWGDPARVPEIFQNLIGNALKYNDRADKRVEVGWLDAPPEGRPLPAGQRVYYVRDNGIGIRPQHLDSVFRIFKRLHARDQYGGGSGAGLTITRKILQRMGGEIWAESVYGEGSCFYFSLPVTAPTPGVVQATPGVPSPVTEEDLHEF